MNLQLRHKQILSQHQSLFLVFSRFLSILTLNRTWSDLIEHLHTSLRNDLKLPSIAKNCQKAMNSIYEKATSEDEFVSIDDLNEEEEDELREKLDMHSVIVSTNNLNHDEPFLTAEQVISEIDFMLQDMTPDSGYCDDLLPSRIVNIKSQSIYSLNELNEELNKSIKDLSSILVQELAIRDELEDEKETKNTFISLVHNIQVRDLDFSLEKCSFFFQNKRRYYQNEKRQKRRSLLGNSNSIEPGTVNILIEKNISYTSKRGQCV